MNREVADSIYEAYIILCRLEIIRELGFDAFRDTQMSAGIIQGALDGGMTEDEVWDCLKNHKIPIGKQERT